MPAEQIKAILGGQSEILEQQTRMLETMRKQQDIIADVVLGTAHENYDGEIVRKGGLADALNGAGFRVKLPWGKILVVVTTLITVAGTIVVAFIETRGGG